MLLFSLHVYILCTCSVRDLLLLPEHAHAHFARARSHDVVVVVVGYFPYQVHEELHTSGGDGAEAQARRILFGLGFDDAMQVNYEKNEIY